MKLKNFWTSQTAYDIFGYKIPILAHYCHNFGAQILFSACATVQNRVIWISNLWLGKALESDTMARSDYLESVDRAKFCFSVTIHYNWLQNLTQSCWFWPFFRGGDKVPQSWPIGLKLKIMHHSQCNYTYEVQIWCFHYLEKLTSQFSKIGQIWVCLPTVAHLSV